MSGSFVVFDSLIGQLIDWIQPRHALDVGAGAGKYGRMLQALVPAGRRVALEPQAGLVERFGLAGVYDELHVQPAAAWQDGASAARFDLAVLGDCLPQMRKSEGLDLLNFLVYRCAYLIVVAPEFMVDDTDADAAAADARRSAWSERDLHWHDLWAHDNCRATGFFLLRGYLPHAGPPLAALVERVNATQIPVHEFNDAASLVRPARLRLVEHPREVSYRPV